MIKFITFVIMTVIAVITARLMQDKKINDIVGLLIAFFYFIFIRILMNEEWKADKKSGTQSPRAAIFIIGPIVFGLILISKLISYISRNR
ncbi:MAG: hypothetical protein LBI90_06610 [Treponema sp.]|nr:hypothetical protein [Treponema sp.]